MVLDASALLAFLHDETGGEKVSSVLEGARVCAVNWSEVLQKSLHRDVSKDIEKAIAARDHPAPQGGVIRQPLGHVSANCRLDRRTFHTAGHAGCRVMIQQAGPDGLSHPRCGHRIVDRIYQECH